jgi:hypothetical protein
MRIVQPIERREEAFARHGERRLHSLDIQLIGEDLPAMTLAASADLSHFFSIPDELVRFFQETLVCVRRKVNHARRATFVAVRMAGDHSALVTGLRFLDTTGAEG